MLVSWHHFLATHTHRMALCPGLPGWAGTRKVKPIWILLKQETVSGSGISWAVCKSAPRSRQITTPAPQQQLVDKEIWKTIKLPYLCSRLTNFDEIWHGDSHLPLTADQPLKFLISGNPRWRRPPSWKSQKSRYTRKLTDLYEIWYTDAKWVS